MKKMTRIGSVLTAACLLVGLLPMGALAGDVQSQHLADCGYSCTHTHDETCGYAEGTPAQDCAHQHGGDCGYSEGSDAVECPNGADCIGEEAGHLDGVAAVQPTSCSHEHDGDCGYATEIPGTDCGHACGEDEWVCAEGCTVGSEDIVVTEMPVMQKQLEMETSTVAIYAYDYGLAKPGYNYDVIPYGTTVTVEHLKGDDDSFKAAVQAHELTQKALEKLQQNGLYYISSVSKASFGVVVYFKIRTVGSITATAENGSISYQTSAMDEAALYTGAVNNDSAMNFYFTPNEGYELSSAKMFQNNIQLTEEADGSYSYAIPENYLYNELAFSVTFIEKPVEAAELTLDVANGPVSVTKSGDNLLVVQGETRYTLTGDTLTLTGTAEDTTNLVTLGNDLNLNLVTKDLTISGKYTRRHIFTVGENTMVDWTLMGTTKLFGPTASAVKLSSGADVTIHGDTLNASNDGQDNAAISVPQNAKLTISGATVIAQGGGAGIGSDTNHNGANSETWAGTIEIINGAKVTAKGGTGAAAIGGGEYSNGGSIHIGADCVVDASAGGNGPAAIGGGERASDGRNGGKAGTIVIDAGATVTAKSASSGSAIGRGHCTFDGTMVSDPTSSITIQKGASITAYTLGHDNSIGDNGKVYFFAIDAGITNNGDAPILNARFDKGALPRKASTVIKDENGNPIGSTPYYNDILVIGNGESIPFALPASSPISAFATTVSGAGSYMVANAAEGKTAERAQYLMEDGDSQFLFTVGEGMTTRDQLRFASYAITATAGENGTISDAGQTAVAPLGGKTYTLTPAYGYVIDVVQVDGQTVVLTDNTYTFENVSADHTIHVTFKTAPVTPPVNPGEPGVTTRTITVKYVDMDGKTLAPSYTTRVNSGSSYDVSAQADQAIAGYSVDHVDGAVTGTAHGNVTITVYYVADTEVVDPEPPKGDLPDTTDPQEPEIDIEDGETPKGNLPESDTAQPEQGEEDGVIIVDPEIPMGSLPQTGATKSVDPTVTLALSAVSASLLLAGAALVIARKKETEN